MVKKEEEEANCVARESEGQLRAGRRRLPQKPRVNDSCVQLPSRRHGITHRHTMTYSWDMQLWRRRQRAKESLTLETKQG